MPPHLRLAQALLPPINKDNTSYVHTDPPLVHWGDDLPPWRSDADCSNFFNALLGKTYAWATVSALNDWFQIPPSEHPKHPRPLAGDYYRAIRGRLTSGQGGVGLSMVGGIDDATGGDILAIDYSTRPDPEHDTGHVMLVESVRLAPDDQQATPWGGTTQWLAQIIDQSDTTHGPGDTRYDADAPHERLFQGLGRGVVRLYVNEGGIIEAYAWVGNHLEPVVTSDRPVVIGRLVDG